MSGTRAGFAPRPRSLMLPRRDRHSLLRETPDEVRRGYARLGADVDLDAVIALDEGVRKLKNDSQAIQADQNRLSKEIGQGAPPDGAGTRVAKGAALKEKNESKAAELAAAESELDEKLLELPNLPHPSVPVGKDESENRVVREEGHEARPSTSRRRPHWDLGTALGHHRLRPRRQDLGQPLLRAQGLGRAPAARAHHLHARPAHRASTATPRSCPPYMVRRECLVGTGNLPKFGDNLYRDAEEDFWFIPTAEVPVTNLYREEILDGAKLPIKHVAFTACFRREKMAAGRDIRGIKRGHQFDKVELVKFVRPGDSMDELRRCSPTPRTC